MYNKNFYPTPPALIKKMLDGVDFRMLETVLEPSAGKGNIVEVIAEKYKAVRYRHDSKCDIDTIENDPNLVYILKGKGIRVVHDDFLTFDSFKKYDLIVMNPPFDNGDKHLLRALELQKNGGKVVCILNAETLKNPFSNTRKDLLRKLEEYDANIEYMQEAFIDAERTTNVEIALVKVTIPDTLKTSFVLDGLKKGEEVKFETKGKTLIQGDFIEGIIQQYNFEIKAGLTILNEYQSLVPHMLKSFEGNDPVLQIVLDGKDNGDKVNGYIKKIRYKYWATLFQSKKFAGLLTEKLREQYYKQLDSLVDYDFSMYNINQITAELTQNMSRNLEDTIIDLFDTLSHKYHWYDETSKNIHMFNGWKTNKSYLINKKVIIPLNNFGYRTWDVENKLADIEKVFNYLDDGTTPFIDLPQTLNDARKNHQYHKIKLKYFTVTFYKKGTCHIEFANLELLKKFNLYECQKKGWLPPTYGKKAYAEMDTEEKAVVDEYEGEKEYNKVMDSKDYYFFDTSKIPLLGG